MAADYTIQLRSTWYPYVGKESEGCVGKESGGYEGDHVGRRVEELVRRCYFRLHKGIWYDFGNTSFFEGFTLNINNIQKWDKF